MGKVNVCVKRSYIVVTGLILIVSALKLAFTLFSHGYLFEDEEMDALIVAIRAMYIISITILLLSITGIFGGCKEKKWALIVFAVGMILSTLFMLVCEISALVMRPELSESIEMNYHNMLPLSHASEADLERLRHVQMQLECCGLSVGFQDWGYNISESCLCSHDATNPCVPAPKNSSLAERSYDDDDPVMIYKEPCLPHQTAHSLAVLDMVVGLSFGLTLLWLLSVVLCVVLLCQMKKKEVPTVVYSQEAKTGNYTVLTETPET